MAFEVKRARRQRRPLKINLEGVSGSGKTYTALRLAFAMRRAGIGKRIVVADSENESAGLYEGVVADGERWEYDVCAMPPDKQNPLGYAEAYEYLVGRGFDIIIADSLTHAWYGAQEIVDRHAAANRNDKFGGWAKVTPQQRAMLNTLTDARAHFIGTMRVKSEYDRQERASGGGAVIKKVGTKTDQREGAEYEFDCVVRMDKGDIPTEHVIVVDKVRGCTAMDGRRGVNPGPEFWQPLFDWWLSAESPHAAHAAAVKAAADLDALKEVMGRVNADAKAGRLTPLEILDLGDSKDRRKAELAGAAPAPVGPRPPADFKALLAAYGSCKTPAEFGALEATLNTLWNDLDPDQQHALQDASLAAKERVAPARDAEPTDTLFDNTAPAKPAH